MKTTLLLLLCFIVLVSCVPGNIAFKFYVVTEPSETARFIEAVASIAKEDGMEIARAHATSDTGGVLTIAEGRGHGVRLLIRNAELSGREDPRLCGRHRGPHPDPAQFFVTAEPRFFDFRFKAAVALGEKVRAQLRKAGFDVRPEPAVCGAAVIRGDAGDHPRD